MVKSKSRFVCQQCGAEYSKWVGRCDNCGKWNSLVEQMIEVGGKSAVSRASSGGKILKSSSLQDVQAGATANRLKTGFSDLDDVLGGGILPGGISLLAGQPGIGKSTLLLQVAAVIAAKNKVLYVSGEESASQVKLRASRLSVQTKDSLQFSSSTSADDIAASIRSGQYDFVVVDSVQTLQLADISSAPGTVSQITNSSNVIIKAAKSTNTAITLVGHVTKEGSIAGPKILEHLVDVVLQFDGDRYGGFKIVRATKNRYGSTAESAIFDMSEGGLSIVDNPSAALLAERFSSDGSVVLATLEGTRPLLVEIQALVHSTSFGYPKRTASGFDLNRLNLLIAVLERRTKLNLSDKDIYINVVGGLKLQDQAADLAVCMAIASASAGRKVGDETVVFGEVGLGGEVRSVMSVDRRVGEAKKLGFTQAIGPKNTKNMFVNGVGTIRQALIDYVT